MDESKVISFHEMRQGNRVQVVLFRDAIEYTTHSGKITEMHLAYQR